MSDRLTQEWTPTLEEAFGEKGARGLLGERFVVDVLSSWGWEVEHFESDRNIQESGVDIAFRNPMWARPYTADVKTNIDQYGSFYVETGPRDWLFNPKKKSDRIWHCNPTTGWMAWYGREEMQRYIRDIGKFNTGLYKITVYDKIDFITRRRVIA